MGCRYSAPLDVMDAADRNVDATFISLAEFAAMEDRRRARGGRSGRISSSSNNSNDALAEIAALQQSLSAMEDFFQNLVGQAQIYMEAMDPNNAAVMAGPPPASHAAIASLLQTPVSSREVSQQCSICCHVYKPQQQVTRLPCGHFYHVACVEPWLRRHCTCPTCRYELPTDDDDYEMGRMERMKSRKLPSVSEEDDESSSQDSSSLWEQEAVHMISELQAATWYQDYNDQEEGQEGWVCHEEENHNHTQQAGLIATFPTFEESDDDEQDSFVDHLIAVQSTEAQEMPSNVDNDNNLNSQIEAAAN